MHPPGGREFGWEGHLLLVYATEQQRRAGVTAWVRRGLASAAKIVYVDSPQGRSLIQVLLEQHPELSHAAARGQLQVVASEVGLRPGWRTHVVREGLAAGYRAVQLGGEAGTSWTRMPGPDHALTERSADQLCGVLPASILCQYSSSLPAPMLERACSLHAGGVREATLQIVPMRAGLAVAGELDVSNVHILRAALSSACARASHPRETFVVDLAGLDFLDVAGARALVHGTAELRSRDVTVRVRAAAPLVDRLLRQFDVVGAHRLVFEDSS